MGCQRLGLTARPSKIAQKQALAAIGQVHLMRYYEDILNALGLVSSKVQLNQAEYRGLESQAAKSADGHKFSASSPVANGGKQGLCATVCVCVGWEKGWQGGRGLITRGFQHGDGEDDQQCGRRGSGQACGRRCLSP